MKAISDSDAGTREALVRAGLDLFGRHGFEASSIREIAQAELKASPEARTNVIDVMRMPAKGSTW